MLPDGVEWSCRDRFCTDPSHLLRTWANNTIVWEDEEDDEDE